jgi:hypothetical protein
MVLGGLPVPCGSTVQFEDARRSGGSHMIDPAGPEVLRFIAAVLAGQQSSSDATGSAVRAP